MKITTSVHSYASISSVSAVEKHCDSVRKLWEEIVETTRYHDPRYYHRFHLILHEISDFTNRNAGMRMDQEFNSEFLSNLADLLVECSLGTANLKSLGKFLSAHWVNHPYIKQHMPDPRILLSMEKATNLAIIPRGEDRRSGVRCRRSAPRGSIPNDRRVGERRSILSASPTM